MQKGARMTSMDWRVTALVVCLLPSLVFASLVFDPDVSLRLEEVVKSDVVVLKVFKSGDEASHGKQLLQVRFPGEVRRFTLTEDDGGVTLVTGDSSMRWGHPKDGSRDTISLAVRQNDDGGAAFTMYRGCEAQAELTAATSFRDVFSQMDKPAIKLYHEKHHKVSVSGGPASEALGCNPVGMDTSKNNKKTFMKTRSPRFFGELMQAQEPYDENVRRGDIPMISTDNCDDILARTLNELIKQIMMLKVEIERQRTEILSLRQTLENCAGCREPAPQRDSCANSPCFSGDYYYNRNN